ncbi:hypothetical protein ACFOPX_08075 [Helicobacter baculiformis]|uniref:Lipoprotein n=1 Tax=Helicobacter baculiformis TaxID=427351 RepID=A0ABV7ZLT9_9HELI|nr:hypothetical protein [Helicobacter baculiformis]
MARVFLCLLIFGLIGCKDNFIEAYKPDFLAEKRTQATRKGEIIVNLRPVVSVLATHLNDVDPVLYHAREFFFLEVFIQDGSYLDNEAISYQLYGLRGAETPAWVREVSKEEFDSVLYTTNKYARGFLIAFAKLDRASQEEAKLEMDIVGLGKIMFNFAYKVPAPAF